MAQIAKQTLTEDWTKFDDIETPVADKTYFIQNRGNGDLLACEGDSEPNVEDGIIVPPHKVLKYIVGSQDLYLRAKNGIVTINISNED